MFAVVEFCKNNGCFETSKEMAIVPILWIYKNDKKCYWPKTIGKWKLEEYVQRQLPYKKSWPVFKIFKVHFKSGIGTQMMF